VERSQISLTLLCLALYFAHPSHAASLLKEARNFHKQGDEYLEDYKLKQALAAHLKAQALFKKHKARPKIQALSLIQVAVVHRELNNFPQAQATLNQAARLLALKPSPDLRVQIEWERGLIEYESGHYAAASQIFAKATELAKHPQADMKNRILLNTDAAMVELEAGHYPRAKAWLDKAQTLLVQHPDLAAEVESEIANNLGFYYMDTGQYKRSEEAFLKALTGYREYYGKRHPRTTIPRANLAVLYETLGSYKEAEKRFRFNLKINTREIGADHYLTAIDMANLARTLQAAGKINEAKKLYLRCLEIDRKQLGDDHPYVIVDLNNLAQLYQELNEPGEAEVYLLAALKLIKQRDVPNSSHLAALDTLAANHVLQSKLEKARDLYHQILALHDKRHSSHTLESTQVMRELALLEQDLGNPAQAREWARRKWAIERQLTKEVFSFTSEKERFEFLKEVDPLHPLISFGTGTDIAELVLHQKGRVLDSLAIGQRQARLSTHPGLKKNFRELETASALLLRLQIQKSITKDSETLQPLMAQVTKQKQKIDELQKTLTHHIKLPQTDYDMADLLKTLPTGSTLVEYVRHQSYEGRNVFGEQWRNQYSVLILTAGRAPQWVPLGQTALLNKLVEKYDPSTPLSDAEYEATLQELYQRLLLPVLSKLPPTTDTLIFAADDQLNFLNFATLIGPNRKFLCEHYKVLHIATGRDLLQPIHKSSNDTLFAFADPEFKPGQPTDPKPSTRDGSLQTLALPPLPGTRRESEFLRQSADDWKLKPHIFTGADAT